MNLLVFELVVLTGLVVSPLFLIRRGHLFEPIYGSSAMFGLHFCVHAWSVYAVKSRYLGGPWPDFDLETVRALELSTAYVTLTYVLFLTGYYGFRSIARRLARQLPPLPLEWSFRRTAGVTLVLIAVGFGGFVLLVWSFGGIGPYIEHKQLTRTAAGRGPFEMLASALPLAFYMTYLVRLVSGRRLFLTSALLMVSVAIAAISGSRGAVLSWIFAIMVMTYYVRRRAVRIWIGLLALAILVLPVYDLYAHAEDAKALARSLSGVGVTSFGIVGAADNVVSRFYGIEALTIIVRDTPKVMDFQFGRGFGAILIAPIPRSLWPGKPVVSTGKLFAQTYFAPWYADSDTAVSVTLLGDAYLNFYVPGMMITGLAIGFFLRWWYEYLLLRRGISGLFVYSAMFPALLMMWENSFEGAVWSYLPPAALACIVAVVSGRRRGLLRLPAREL